jgi:hypothetical protein
MLQFCPSQYVAATVPKWCRKKKQLLRRHLASQLGEVATTSGVATQIIAMKGIIVIVFLQPLCSVANKRYYNERIVLQRELCNFYVGYHNKVVICHRMLEPKCN